MQLSEIVLFSSGTQSCLTLCDPINRSTPGLPVHHQLPESTKPMSIASVMPFNYLILCHPLLLLPSIFPSIRVFSNESALTSSGLGIGVSASTSALPMNIQGWFPLGLTDLISWQNSVSLCLASFCIPRPNLPITPGISWLLAFAFQSPMMKLTSFFVCLFIVLEGLVSLHRTVLL